MEDYIYNTFKQTSRTRLLNAINRSNSTALTEDDVVFSPPSWYHDEGHGTNTRVTVISTPSSTVQGRADFFYTRPSLGDLFGSTTPSVQVTGNMLRSVDLLEAIEERYRIRLDRDDVIDETLPEMTEEPTQYRLKASTWSLGWVDDLIINLHPVTAVLDSRITNPHGSIADFTPAPGSTRAELWFGPRRLLSQSDVAPWLENTPAVDDGLSAWMIDQIRAYYGPEWSSVPMVVEDFNLYDARIAYVGPNTADIGVPGSPEDMVVLVRLSTYSRNYSGYLILSLPEHLVRAYHDTAPE